MVSLLSVVINALVLSAIFALVALGLTLIFSVAGVFNLAHGVNVTLGAFTAWYVATVLGQSIWLAAVLSILVPAVFSVALYKGMVQAIESRPMTVMTVTLLVELISEYLIRELIGLQSRSVPALVPGVVRFGGATLTVNRIIAFFTAWALVGVLFVVFDRTKQGKAVIATSMSERGSTLVGIDKSRVQLYTWFAAGALAGIAGLFFGSIRTASWDMGLNSLVIAFPIVVLGGMGSIRGTLIAANIFGFLNVFILSYWEPTLARTVPIIALILILLVRPEGLLGREVAT